eukprot:1879286-Ditylum_brightwellii.AAC.1
MPDKSSGNVGKGKDKGDGGEKNGKKGKTSKPDDCHLPGHNHKWSVCPNNPRSDCSSGVHFKEIMRKADAKKKIQKNNTLSKVYGRA